jgi:ubiquinone biosynthesis protein UbiJ
MQKIISVGLFTALLASANVSAETRITPVYGSIHASGTKCVVTGDQASASACNNRQASKQQKSAANTLGESRPANTQRVHLDDYQRLPQAVSKQHRTTPLLLGQNKESR